MTWDMWTALLSQSKNRQFDSVFLQKKSSNYLFIAFWTKEPSTYPFLQRPGSALLCIYIQLFFSDSSGLIGSKKVFKILNLP